MRRTLALSVVLLGLFVAGLAAGAADLDPAAVDEEALRAAGVSSDGPGLVAFFRKQTTAEPARERVQQLLKQLGDDSFEARERASAALIGLGATAEPYLKQTIEELKKAVGADLEVLRRAEECLRRIGDRSAEAQVLAAAARTLARRKPAGAAEALLAYLPGAPDDHVVDAIQTALGGLAGSDTAPEPVLLNALSDKVALRRAIAGAALCQFPGNASRRAVRKLLEDSDVTVRHRVAVALAMAGEKDAVPVLIQMLAELPQQHAYQAEQMLCRLADEQAPSVPYGNSKEVRARCRDAWVVWWKANGDTVEMTRLTTTAKLLGYTLIVLLYDGRVLELDAKNQPRWELKGIDFPLDAQLLAGGRILFAEQAANRVTERNLKGEVLWERKVGEPLMAQRLANGNTFIATKSRIVEVDRDGLDVFSYTPTFGEGIMRAQRLANGQIALVTQTYLFKRLDATGTRELASFPVKVRTMGGRIEVLPNYHVIVPEKDDQRVVEYDTRGAVVWQVAVREPIAAVRLANGNTLVTSMGNDFRAVEFSKKGEEVWEYKSATKVTRAFRR